jgi:hypothetical protein
MDGCPSNCMMLKQNQLRCLLDFYQKSIDTSKLTTFKDAAWYSTFQVGVIIV